MSDDRKNQPRGTVTPVWSEGRTEFEIEGHAAIAERLAEVIVMRERVSMPTEYHRFGGASTQGTTAARDGDLRSRLESVERELALSLDVITQLEEQHRTDAALIGRLEDQRAADRDRIGNLEIALRTSRRIGAAVGILMHARQVSEDEAFEVLRVESQTSHRKLHHVADSVVQVCAPGKSSDR